MWSNSVRNLLLLAIWMVFAWLIWVSYQWTDALLTALEWSDDSLFGTSSYESLYEWTIYYVDAVGTEFEIVDQDVVTFCEGVMGEK